MQSVFELIRIWAKERGIYKKGNSHTQYVKLQEEAGELAKALLKNNRAEIVDSIGDIVVVLTNLAELEGLKIEDCIQEAYNVIKNRTGKMQNGTFVKDEKPTVNAKKSSRGYYNLPCQHKEILAFLTKANIKVGDKVYTSADDLHIRAKPSKSEGGVAYIYA